MYFYWIGLILYLGRVVRPNQGIKNFIYNIPFIKKNLFLILEQLKYYIFSVVTYHHFEFNKTFE